jgi:hypothetical protein
LEYSLDKRIILVRFDRQKVIISEEIQLDEGKNRLDFLALIAGFSRFSRKDWGIATEFYPQSPDNPTVTVPCDNHNLHLDSTSIPYFRSTSLLGRGTMVLRGTWNPNDGGNPRDVAVKVSYPEKQRSSEGEIIKEGRAALTLGKWTRHLPEVLDQRDFGYSTCDHRLPGNKEEGSRLLRMLVFKHRLETIDTLPSAGDGYMVIKGCMRGNRIILRTCIGIC